MEDITIDATGKKLGRLASQIAHILQGKHKATYAKNVVAPVKIVVENAAKLDIDPRRLGEIYFRYSGYPGGQKRTTLAEIGRKKGYGQALELAINKMLPKNTLRPRRLKNLTIHE